MGQIRSASIFSLIVAQVIIILLLVYSLYRKDNQPQPCVCQTNEIVTSSPSPTLESQIACVNDSQIDKQVGQQIEQQLVQQNESATVEQMSNNSSKQDAYIALCLIAKNENKFIREWVDYHKFIGVQKFYVYDHNSSTPMSHILQDYIAGGLVDYRFFSDDWKSDEYGLNKKNFYFNGVKQVNSPQRWVHNDCFIKNKEKHKFMGMIDIDEFIVLNQGKAKGYKAVSNPNFPEYLKKFEEVGGLMINWRLYGSSGHKESPPGGVLENYVNCESSVGSTYDRTDVKHMVNTKYMGNAFCVIHVCNTTRTSVDPLGRPKAMTQNKKMPTWEGISLNHYILKSHEDYKKKRARGGGHSPKNMYADWRSDTFFRGTDSMAKGDCSFMRELYKQCCAGNSQI